MDAKLLRLTGPDVVRYNDYRQHLASVEFCHALLEAQEGVLRGENTPLRTALWVAVLRQYFGSFTRAPNRRPLTMGVFGDNALALGAFRRLDAERRRHDDGAWSMAAVADVTQGPPQLRCAGTSAVLCVGEFKPMHSLTELTGQYLARTLNTLSARIGKRLARMPPEELQALEPFQPAAASPPG